MSTPTPSIGTFPNRHNTVTAEVLCSLCKGATLTGMDAVFGCSTTRLAAVIHYLNGEYGWNIDHVEIDVATNDGRVALIRAYFMPRAVIRRAFDAGEATNAWAEATWMMRPHCFFFICGKASRPHQPPD